jgi:hypothetical protein
LCAAKPIFVPSIGKHNDRTTSFAEPAIGGHNPDQVANRRPGHRRTVSRSRPKLSAAKRLTGAGSKKQKPNSDTAKPA